jgi:TatD DNase family protein
MIQPETDFPFINIHTHFLETEGISLFNLQKTDGKFEIPEKFLYSTGLHPWFLDDLSESTFKQIAKWVEADNCLALGEAGLDRICKTDFEWQKKWFIKQAELSETSKKPMIIHCVKAFDEILKIRKQIRAVQPWIFHGFNNKPEYIPEILDVDCYISLGIKSLEIGTNANKALKQIPPERLFFETDDKFVRISDIYKHASNVLNIELVQLKCKLFQNFKDCLQK